MSSVELFISQLKQCLPYGKPLIHLSPDFAHQLLHLNYITKMQAISDTTTQYSVEVIFEGIAVDAIVIHQSSKEFDIFLSLSSVDILLCIERPKHVTQKQALEFFMRLHKISDLQHLSTIVSYPVHKLKYVCDGTYYIDSELAPKLSYWLGQSPNFWKSFKRN